MPASQRDWNAVDANTSASLIGDGRGTRHVHARYVRYSCISCKRGNASPYCLKRGTKSSINGWRARCEYESRGSWLEQIPSSHCRRHLSRFWTQIDALKMRKVQYHPLQSLIIEGFASSANLLPFVVPSVVPSAYAAACHSAIVYTLLQF